MELSQAVDTVLLLLDEQGQIFDELEKKALNKLIATVSLVDKIGGVVPPKKSGDFCPPIWTEEKAVSESSFKIGYNEARAECIAAFAGCVLSEEEISEAMDSPFGHWDGIGTKMTSEEISKVCKAIRALQLQKIGGGK